MRQRIKYRALLPIIAGGVSLAATVAMAAPSTQSGTGNPTAKPNTVLLASGCRGCKGCNPCAGDNPCAGMHDHMEMNPCAGDNPCAGMDDHMEMNPCAGDNPCAGMHDNMEMNDAQAEDKYSQIIDRIRNVYANANLGDDSNFLDWKRYSNNSYASGTHGGRFVNNYANQKAANYIKYEDAGIMPEGAIIAKDSFTISKEGTPLIGPLFVMEKMQTGFRPDAGDWKYSLYMADGSLYAVSGGKNSSGVEFCVSCHMVVADYDHMFFLPPEYRVSN